MKDFPDSSPPPNTEAAAPESDLNLVPRSLAEWVTFGVSTLILLVLVGLTVFDWYISHDRPPAFVVEVAGVARETQGRYYVPFAIKNTGGQIARTVQVTATLTIEGEVPETGDQEIDFLSGNERKRGSFVFTRNPAAGDLQVRVASYRLP